MSQPAGIILFRPCQSLFKSAAIATFISHRPDDHTGTVFVPFHQLFYPVKSGFIEFWIIRYQFVPSASTFLVGIIGIAQHPRSMALIVCFIDDKEAIFVTHLIKHRLIRIMAGPDCIEIVLFHHFQILFHLLYMNHKPGHRI